MDIFVLVIWLDDINVKGYIVWLLMDNFEWVRGYLECFGFYYVDFNDFEKLRIFKVSVFFYKKIIIDNGFVKEDMIMLLSFFVFFFENDFY